MSGDGQTLRQPILVLRLHVRFGASNTEIVRLDHQGQEHFVTRVDSWTLPDRDDSRVRPHLEEALAAGILQVIVDLGDVIVLSSVALAELIDWHNMIGKQQGAMVLCNPGERVRQSLRVTKLDEVFPVTGTLDEARAVLRAAAGS